MKQQPVSLVRRDRGSNLHYKYFDNETVQYLSLLLDCLAILMLESNSYIYLLLLSFVIGSIHDAIISISLDRPSVCGC